MSFLSLMLSPHTEVQVGAIEKTSALQRLDIPVGMLAKNASNPNKMGSREFDLLVDNIEQTGLTDPILVRQIDVDSYEIVGGHHRYEAASFLGFETVPCTVITDPDFDQDQADFQLVRMNLIKGKLDPEAFFALYQKVAEKYSDDVLQESFGFADEAEFKKLITQMSKQLPDKGLQDKFKEAAQEIKTIDGLSKLLNEMFTKYGDTLPFGYMVFDHGGKRSMWLRIEGKTMKALDLIGHMCIENDRTVDDVIGKLAQLIARGDFPEIMAEVLKGTPVTKIAKTLKVAPTKDNLAKVDAIS